MNPNSDKIRMMQAEMARFENEISGPMPRPPMPKFAPDISLQFVPHSVHKPPGGATYAPPMLSALGRNVPRPPFPPAVSGFPPRPRLPVIPAPTSTVVIEGAPTKYNTNMSAPTVGITPAIYDEMTGQMGPAFTTSITSTSSLPFPEMAKKTAAAVAPKASQPGTSKGPQQQAPKRYVRTAGGEIWQDPTLLEWDPSDYRVFCGDLGNEVSDELLAKAFRKYPSFQRAKVVRDKRTNKTKGYGFVSFKDPQDFIRALREMDGKYVGNRPIKLRKSMWKERNLKTVKKKDKEKRKLGMKL